MLTQPLAAQLASPHGSPPPPVLPPRGCYTHSGFRTSHTLDKLINIQVVEYLVDLLHDPHREVARAADGALDVVMDTSEEWAVQIRTLKFRAHCSVGFWQTD